MDSYIYAIVALLPLTACMVVLQTNPYHALVMRGILGAISALTYTVLGAPDVALTEALVGTLLAITLYAVAVRSSLVLRVGVTQEAMPPSDETHNPESEKFQPLLHNLKTIFKKHHLRVELVPYHNQAELEQALMEQEVHATCTPSPHLDETAIAQEPPLQPYHTTTRLQRLYDIMQPELASSIALYTDVKPSDPKEKH